MREENTLQETSSLLCVGPVCEAQVTSFAWQRQEAIKKCRLVRWLSRSRHLLRMPGDLSLTPRTHGNV